MTKKKKLQIRNSTAEFLIFTNKAKEDGIEVRVQDESIWLSQKMMSVLFDCSTDNISLHLRNIFKENELDENSVVEEFSVTASDGAYLDLAEDRAKRHIPMTMEDWGKRLDKFLEADDRDILHSSGKITALMAKDFANNEFEKYRIVQDRLFESDFDKEIKRMDTNQM